MSEITPRREVPVPSPEASLTVADGQDSWIYRLATDTRLSFQQKATPVATPTSSIDNAMLSLNEALEDLGKLRVRTEAHSVDLNLSSAEARTCIDGFVSVMSTMLAPDAFASSMLDMDLLYVLPDIINSPYVNIDPALRVMYYNALFYGLQLTDGPGGSLTKKAYMKMLESVPAWLKSQKDTNMDIHTACLSGWTAMAAHDYKLAWNFHCKACQHVTSMGIDRIDDKPARSFDEESERDIGRQTYWFVLCIDTFFRLFYGKPTVLRWTNKVRPPLLFRPDNMHPSALHVTISAVWIRYTLLTVEAISYIDNDPPHDQASCLHKADDSYIKMEALIAEWRLEEMMNGKETSDDVRCLLADHIMNIYATIIGIQRLAKQHQTRPGPKDITLRAARRVLSIIIDFYADPNLNAKFRSITNHFITLYPFCVVFPLYEHIVACTNPDDCESDIQALETIGIAMTQSCTQRQDLVPFAKTINALNRVSRTLQDERRKGPATLETGDDVPQGMGLPSNFDTIQNLMASELPDIDMSAFSSMPDYAANVEGDFQSLGFFRALENDFVAKNWQTDWWDLGGGEEGAMGQMPGTDSAGFPYHTPDT